MIKFESVKTSIMIDEIKKILKKKHILIVGGSSLEREKFIKKLIEVSNFETYQFPKKSSDLYDYLEHVEKQKMFKAWYSQKQKFGINQLLDFHWDWLHQNNVLIVIEDIDDFEEEWKLELIRIYLDEIENHKKGDDFVHLIISQQKESGLIQKLADKIEISDNENRTKKQIIQGSLKVIDLDTLK